MSSTSGSKTWEIVMGPEDKNRLWDEYKYRHQHVWNTIFKLTASVVLVSMVPYTNRETACVLGWAAVVPPVVATGLAFFGYKRMKREVEILTTIRTAHRHQQGLIKSGVSSFDTHVDRFLQLLILAAAANAVIVLLVWRPALMSLAAVTSSCFAK